MIRSLRIAVLVFASTSITSVTSIAFADVPHPDERDCGGKAVGAACVTEGPSSTEAGDPGTCTNAKCMRNVYADGGMHQEALDCVLCVAVDGGSTKGDAGSDAAALTDAAGSSQARTQDASTSATGDEGDDIVESESGGCSATGSGLGQTFGPWLIALTVPFFMRRRKQG